VENKILEIMKDINQRITNIENQEQYLKTENEKSNMQQQKNAFKECLKIVSNYL
jgi:uncharacterized protein YdcH (DUF465 family)